MEQLSANISLNNSLVQIGEKLIVDHEIGEPPTFLGGTSHRRVSSSIFILS